MDDVEASTSYGPGGEGVGLPWDAAGLGDLDFSEHLLVFAEDDPSAAAAKLQEEKEEAARLRREADNQQTTPKPEFTTHSIVSGFSDGVSVLTMLVLTDSPSRSTQ
eukprot:scaffold162112_cov23-Prasinocladus_malaysianus.AAC.1